jgi:hypothetical protein
MSKGNDTSILSNFFNNQSLNIQRIFTEFKKPRVQNVFFTNLILLKSNSDYYDFVSDSWYQRPTVFCLDVYNEPQIFPVIMMVNNIKTFFEFTPTNFNQMSDGRRIIISPHYSTILEILNTSKS